MKFIGAKSVLLILLAAGLLPACGSKPAAPPRPTEPPSAWQDDFQVSRRKLESTGVSRYFVLLPGYRAVLSSGTGSLTITVTNDTKVFGGITARAVEERETQGSNLLERTLDYYALDPATGDVFYFGEEVDVYDAAGLQTAHPGAWLAYENDNRPGLIMPGTPLVGMKYYQEWAPGLAMDRAKVISISESVSTTAGDFSDCLLTQESSRIEAGVVEYKTYCPGVGLVQDESYVLSNYIPVADANP